MYFAILQLPHLETSQTTMTDVEATFLIVFLRLFLAPLGSLILRCYLQLTLAISALAFARFLLIASPSSKVLSKPLHH